MGVFNLDFTHQRVNPIAVETKPRATHNGCGRHGAASLAANALPLTGGEGEKFMRVVAQGSRLTRHYELFQLLQGEDIQHFIPHQIMISAWCDSEESSPKIDVISAVPGVRTGLLNCCAIDELIKDLCRRWLLRGRRPLLYSSATDARLVRSNCNCALHKYLQGSWSLLVHGVTSARDNSQSLYLVLNANAVVSGYGIEQYRLLVDPLIAQIDVAFRRIEALKVTESSANKEYPTIREALSMREEEVLRWVSEGRTNAEIAEVLNISPFTVKNHVQQIMRKLDAANRTEAVATYRQIHPQGANEGVARERALTHQTARYA